MTAAPARHHAHKIDSLLRGNWAHELVAVQRAAGERVLLVPALPRLGRVCRGGVVHVDGLPVDAHDARRAATSPRPADHLVAAGGSDVVELADADAVDAWLARAGAFAVCDATSDDDLAAIAAVWRRSDGIHFAGTAGAVAAAVGATRRRERAAALAGDVLVVCGSLHATARSQLDALGDASVGAVTVLRSPHPDGQLVTDADAARMAADLATAAHDVMARGRAASSSSSVATPRPPSWATSRSSWAVRWRRACRGHGAPTAAGR